MFFWSLSTLRSLPTMTIRALSIILVTPSPNAQGAATEDGEVGPWTFL
jgi:hypothetical protein